ncbi:hypothetical protein JAAARDRAFT_39004 [Jaapia argillacea MUCL 33604]|uniref:Uncharacterized protein n=1 Tax=Jaapia argillacea MUCL 33604 TaxID=933084 RepID=A0A067PIL5_9AGAM|nr:hypothetical protein JAAARDRAFT_39004 [Jaapia argillacea MUCL 33604]
MEQHQPYSQTTDSNSTQQHYAATQTSNLHRHRSIVTSHHTHTPHTRLSSQKRLQLPPTTASSHSRPPSVSPSPMKPARSVFRSLRHKSTSLLGSMYLRRSMLVCLAFCQF